MALATGLRSEEEEAGTDGGKGLELRSASAFAIERLITRHSLEVWSGVP